MLEDKQQQWSRLRELLECAQAKMKGLCRSEEAERVFQKGDQMYLKLQPYRMVVAAILKLVLKYFGSYEILEKLGRDAYKLALLESYRMHSVFHVSQLLLGKTRFSNYLKYVNMVPLI